MDDSDSLFEGMVLFSPNSTFEPEEIHHQALELPSSDPLDESLFSDLTIESPVTDPPSESSREIPVISRQVSRKKKRASLRIGYGRQSSSVATEAEDDDEADEPQIAPRSSHDDAIPPIPNGDQSSRDNTPSEIPAIPNGDQSSRDDLPSEIPAMPNGDHSSVDDDDRDEIQLERIKARIAEKLESARRCVTEVSSRRKAAISGRRKAAETLRAASEAHSDLERRLNEACETEDFEAAERLSDELAAAESERLSLAAAMREAETNCDAVEASMEAALAAQIAAEEECASLLDGFGKDASSKADSVIRTAQEASSNQMEKWNSSTEALEVRKMELEIESRIVEESRSGLNASLEHLVEDDKKEKESLCKKKDALTDELQKLLLLVKQKEQEIEETDRNIEVVDERIANVAFGFRDMQSDFESKVDILQSGLSEIESEGEVLAKKKKEIDGVVAREEENGERLRELANSCVDEAKTLFEVVGLRKALMVSVLKVRENKARLAKTEEKLSNEVQMLRQVISSSRASLQELSARKSLIQQDMTSSKQKIIFIDKRVPELEAEKKVAAAARNFKEAARIAAEAKSLVLEKDTLQIAIERAVSDLEKLEGEIRETVEKLQETETAISSKENDVAMARFERLLLISGSAAAERAAALEFGNEEEAELLLLEAEAADFEAKALKPMHGFEVEEFGNMPKHFISMELVANLGKKQLQELAASVHFSPA